MKFMIMGRVSEESESGALPDPEYVEQMHRFNAELVQAGVLLAAEGLHPSSRGARISYKGGKGTVVDGPFTESKELIAGFWLIDVRSRDEALAWALRIPVPADAEGEGFEVRQIFEAPDVAAALRAQALLPELERALAQLAAAIDAADPARAADPTPCPAWDLRALVEHAAVSIGDFAEAAGGRRTPPQPGASWSAAFRTASDDLLAAWRAPGALEQTRKLGPMEVDAAWAVRQNIAECVGHAWDVTRATGDPRPLDPALTATAYAFVTENLRPGMRTPGGAFGPEVPAPADAPPETRLAAFLGRDPAWTP